ncbi:MAG: caspase family protein [Desulfuromonadaceae bacterium]|nr:caspase family protein [Desulfuromonadaceae bacterium]
MNRLLSLLFCLLVFMFCCGFFGSAWYEEYGLTKESQLYTQAGNDVLKKIIFDTKNRHFSKAIGTAINNPFSLEDNELIERLGLLLPQETQDRERAKIAKLLANSPHENAVKFLADHVKEEKHRNIVALIISSLIDHDYYTDDLINYAKIMSKNMDYLIKTSFSIYLVNNRSLHSEVIERASTGIITEITQSKANRRRHVFQLLSRSKYVTEDIYSLIQNAAFDDPHPNVKRDAAKAMSLLKKYSLENIQELKPNFYAQKLIDSNFNSKNFNNDSSIALIVGNKDYSKSGNSVPDVDYAINDAAAIKEYLVNAKGYKEGNILYLENASQAQMVSALGNKESHMGKLFNWVRPNESDVFFYYSGHGAPSLKDGSGYLLPVNADPSTVELNGYSIDTLYANLEKLSAKSITVVLDACFSGSSQAGTIIRNASSISLKPISMPKTSSKINVLTATNVGEVASWDTEAKHGLFTSYFLKGINGDADKGKSGNADNKVSLAELKRYLDLEVSYMARRQYGREQNPQVSGSSNYIFSELAD